MKCFLIIRREKFFCRSFSAISGELRFGLRLWDGKGFNPIHSLGGDVTGSDFSDAMLKVAQKRMDANGQ